MTFKNEDLKKYIEKNKGASVEQIAVKFGVCGRTIVRNASKIGYVLKKVWVKNG